MELKKKMILSLTTVTALSMLTTVPTFAFGEYGQSDGTTILNNGLTSTDDYASWYENQWNNQESGEMDSGKMILTPGINEKSLNFAWYSETKGKPQIKVSQNKDMSDAKTFEGNVTDINKTNSFKTYVASNKVSVDNYFNENTTYYYQYTVDGTWSETYEYTTHSFTNYQAIVVGDPQIGASGSHGQGTQDDLDIAVNTYAWNKTLQMALGDNGIAKDASFILSAGDQVDYSSAGTNNAGYVIREQEYAGYLYPNVLRSVPVATTIGNHESLGDDYSLHYNNPNASQLGQTTSGGDYYYSYGQTLYIVLNSNSRNVEEHRQLMKEAVASHKDAKWKIVLFHHDIYGSGSPHSDVDGANLRILFAPLMDEFDIDVCLTGHDHSYARTFQILDGKVIETEGVNEGTSTAYNPEGTLYIAAGSASGSKFYTLNATKQYYIAERSNTPIPTFSTLDFTDGSLTIKTYDSDGQKYAYDVTIKKDNQATSIEELKNTVKALDQSSMTSGSKQRINEALSQMQTALDSRDDKEAIQTLTSTWNSSLDPLSYYAYAQNGYANETSTALRKGFSTLLDKTLYENDTNEAVSNETLQKVYNQLLLAKDEVVTKQEFSQLLSNIASAEEKLATITIGNQKGEYTAKNVQELKQAIATLKVQIDETTITQSQLQSFNESLTNAVQKFEASVNAEDPTTPSITPTNPDDSSTTTHSTPDNPSVSQSPTTNDQQQKPSQSNVVKTGDSTNYAVAGGVGIVSMLAIAALQFLKKKEQ